MSYINNSIGRMLFDKNSEIIFFGKMPPLKLALNSGSIPQNDNCSTFSVEIIVIQFNTIN